MTPTEMIPHLQDYYAEQVIDGLGRRDRAKFVRDVNVQFVQALEATNGLMFELCISLKPIYSIDLQPLVVRVSGHRTEKKRIADPTKRLQSSQANSGCMLSGARRVHPVIVGWSTANRPPHCPSPSMIPLPHGLGQLPGERVET